MLNKFIVCMLLNTHCMCAAQCSMLIACVLLNAQYAHCMCTAQCSICSLHVCCSMFNRLSVCAHKKNVLPDVQ